ncbi:hypothetical protein ACH42_14255 [Endozoicomonas sp. (ex Bugula neritina AB1)]|nr:hypothetical protein ACH42_14255 [Endozoicomonas sp. (ex Bugula neritina AB1)]
MLDEDQIRCLKWRSRRGMLELDVLLEPFTNEALPKLNEQDQLTYVRLLECEDPDLFSWFMSDERPEDPQLNRMVGIVLERGRYKVKGV